METDLYTGFIPEQQKHLEVFMTSDHRNENSMFPLGLK